MPILIDCPSCTRKLRVPEDLLGQKVKCPGCSTVFQAADRDNETSPAPAEHAVGEEEEASRARRRDVSSEEDYDDDPRARRRRRGWQPEDDDDDRPRRRRSREKPGKVQAIAIMTLVGGILALINGVSWLAGLGIASFGICCLWPGPYFGVVMGIMAITRGSALLGQEAYLQPPPRGIAIMQIINIINFDVPNCVMGIISLTFQNDPEVQRFFRGTN